MVSNGRTDTLISIRNYEIKFQVMFYFRSEYFINIIYCYFRVKIVVRVVTKVVTAVGISLFAEDG